MPIRMLSSGIIQYQLHPIVPTPSVLQQQNLPTVQISLFGKTASVATSLGVKQDARCLHNCGST